MTNASIPDFKAGALGIYVLLSNISVARYRPPSLKPERMLLGGDCACWMALPPGR